MFSAFSTSSMDAASEQQQQHHQQNRRKGYFGRSSKSSSSNNNHKSSSAISSTGSFKSYTSSTQPSRSDVRDDQELEPSESKTFWKGEKKQRKAVYSAFSDDPKAVLLTKTDTGIPQINSKYDVVIKVQASTVSYNDCLNRRGMSFGVTDPVCLPATPGMDLVGYIISAGEYVKGFKEGDRVAALVRTGGNARYAVVNYNALVPVPRMLDSGEAVCMISTYMTAYQSLKLVIGKERTLEGKKVLVTGAIGPTGQALIQMAKRAGAEKIYATAPAKMHRYVKLVLGAKPLPMEPAEWLPKVEGQMDIVMDGVCQDSFESPRKALSSKGVLVCVGMAALMNSESMGAFGAPMSAQWTRTKAEWFMSRTKFYDVWSSFQSDPKKFKNDLEHVFKLLKTRDIKPHISKRVCLSDVAESQVYLELGKARGVIVCMPWRKRIPGTGLRGGHYGEQIVDEDEEDQRDT